MAREPAGDDYMVCDQCRARKIRCSREKPSCRNCERLGLQCEWSGQGKKSNQTTLLSHTIVGMGSRLQNLESSLVDTQRSLKRLFEASSMLSPPPTALRASPSTSTPQVSPQQVPNSLTTPTFARPRWRFLLDQDDERCFGPTSLESLMLNIKDELSESPEVESNALEKSVVQAQRKIDLLVLRGEEKSTDETALPTAPPFAILDAMIELYFGGMNHHFPIWTKKRFTQMATVLRQSPSSEQDLASIVCCNNLILMTMSAESLRAHQRDSVQSRKTRKTSSIDFDIIAGFLANAKRAVKNVDRLLSPRLINVQALLSLYQKYMVAHEHLSLGQSETLLVLAARCAKSVGINQWPFFEGQISDEEMKERRNISQGLYILDKAICWTAGTSPSIPLSEMHFDICLASPDNRVSYCHAAKVEMARIEEAIYLEIYATHVKPRSEDQVQAFAALILSRLQRCLADSGVDPDKIQNEPESSASDLQLLIKSLCVQLLITWPHKRHPDLIFQRYGDVARMCMKLLLRLWNSQPYGRSYGFFPLFLASLPPLYLYEMLSAVISGQDSNSDLEMLQKFVDMLQTITDCRAETSYNRRLYQLSIIVINVVNTRKGQHKRQKPTSTSNESPSIAYLMAELQQSPPADDFNYMNPEAQEIDNSSLFDSAIFHDHDSLSASRSPISSRPGGDLVRGADNGLLPQLWSYAEADRSF